MTVCSWGSKGAVALGFAQGSGHVRAKVAVLVLVCAAFTLGVARLTVVPRRFLLHFQGRDRRRAARGDCKIWRILPELFLPLADGLECFDLIQKRSGRRFDGRYLVAVQVPLDVGRQSLHSRIDFVGKLRVDAHLFEAPKADPLPKSDYDFVEDVKYDQRFVRSP